MKKRVNVLMNKILMLFSIFFILGSFLNVSKAAEYVSTVKAKKDSDGNIILKYKDNNGEKNRKLKPKIGSTANITNQSLGLPYVLCFQQKQGIEQATYTLTEMKEEKQNLYAYILATNSDRKYSEYSDKYWLMNKVDRVQIATWKSNANQGDFNGIDKWIINGVTNATEANKAWYEKHYTTNINTVKKDIREGDLLFDEAEEFDTYRKNYKKAKQNPTTPSIHANNIIGPFNITFTRAKSKKTGRVFGGWVDETSHTTIGRIPFTLTAVMADGTTKELKNDGTDWDFVDKYGKHKDGLGLTKIEGIYEDPVYRPTSGKDFYIQIRNPDVVKVTKLKLNFFNTEAYAKWYKLKDRDGGDEQQLLGVIDNGYIRKNPESLEIEINMDLQIKLAGHVFLDGAKGKENEPNGIKDKNDEMKSGITVNLRKYSDKSIVATTTTNKDGYYEFKVKPDTYYVEFIYDGQNYEPTTYNMQKKEVADGIWNKTGIPERSYATDGKKNRQSFNAEYAEITGDVARAREISAFTGKNGEQELKTYSIKNSKEERENINLGLLEREKANIVLSKDLWEVKLTINGYSETYIYKGRDGEDMKIALRGTDVNQYQRPVRKTDVPHIEDIKVTYRIRLYNASGNINTEVSQLVDWYDSSYQLERLYTEDQKDIAYTKEAENDNFTKVRTNGYSSGAFSSGENRYIYADYTIDKNAIQGLITGEETLENYAEIGGYKTYYPEKRMDLNNDLVMHEAGEIAGLVDINSEPNNFDPNDEKVDNFVHKESKTEEYKNLSGEDKAARSFEFFQDDADVAPGLKLVLSNEVRTITGNVWDDFTTVDKDNIRKGDGVFKDESAIKNVKVELIDAKTGKVVEFLDEQGKETRETRTNDAGSYIISGFIPGEYYIRFTYGDQEALRVHEAKYNGQDYKSTLYDKTKFENPYWYTGKEDATRYSDAADNMTRREEVNGYSKKMTNYKATLLAAKDSTKDKADKTYMFADTANMIMEVEYAQKETPYDENNSLPEYAVKDIDFGLAERPHSQLTIDKTVSNVRMITPDGQDILAVTNAQGPNLAWVSKGEDTNQGRGYIQATVDNALINGASIFIDYNITVKNKSEVNYVQGDDMLNAKEDEAFYHTGQQSKNAKPAKIKADYIVDYINNNLVFNKDENNSWEIIDQQQNPNELFKDRENEPGTIIDKNLKSDIDTYQTIIKASNNSALLKELAPDETSEAVSLHLKQIGMATEGKDTLQYDNGIEIAELTEQVGRRQQDSIVGNFNPAKPVESLELDSSLAETVTVLPPFGNSNIIYLVSAIAIVSILGIGIFFIIRKVLPKQK